MTVDHSLLAPLKVAHAKNDVVTSAGDGPDTGNTQITSVTTGICSIHGVEIRTTCRYIILFRSNQHRW
jgi:hypothetical protein